MKKNSVNKYRLEIVVHLAIVVATIVSVTSCATAARIRANPMLDAQSMVYPVTIPDRFLLDDQLNISAGPYRVTHADRGWTRSSSHKEPSILAAEWMSLTFSGDPFLDLLPRIETSRTKLTYAFAQEAVEPTEAKCGYATRHLKVRIDRLPPVVPGSGQPDISVAALTMKESLGAKFKCVLTQSSHPDRTLALDVYTHGLHNGSFAGERDKYRILRSFSSELIRSDGAVFTIPIPVPVGYEIFRADVRVGALVSLRNEPRVIVASELDDVSRRDVVEAAVSLMLYEMAFDEK